MTSNNHLGKDRNAFRGRIESVLHPSKHIESPKQLYGRKKSLSQMQDAFETTGTHPFIWGVRGIGKTSLGHTACAFLAEQVILAAVVSCTKGATFREVIDDIVADSAKRNPSLLKNKRFSGSIQALGITLSTEINGFQSTRESISVSQAANLIETTFGIHSYGDKIPVVMVDEFDRLENQSTIESVSDLLKQLSVINARMKFCFCGVTDDLGDLLSAHQSVERYLYAVELRPVSYDAMLELIADVCAEFGVELDRGKAIRVTQIAAGYPHFAHLILKNILLAAFESDFPEVAITDELFREGLNRSSSQAATRLRTAYESAIRKGNPPIFNGVHS